MGGNGDARKPASEPVSATDAARMFGAMLHRAVVNGERVVITRNGRPVAELVRVGSDAPALAGAA